MPDGGQLLGKKKSSCVRESAREKGERSMAYTTSQLFTDCATRNNKRLGAIKPFTSECYAKVWDAVTRWVNSQLSAKKGASLQGFATITYRKTERSSTSMSLSPVFLLHEGFSRGSMMATRRSAPTIKELTINEEMNFSKLAIMFVGDIKKDTVSACWKNMVLRIGEVMKDGVEVRLDFGVGVMVARDNKVDFNFRPAFKQAAASTAVASEPSRPPPQTQVRLSKHQQVALDRAPAASAKVATPPLAGSVRHTPPPSSAASETRTGTQPVGDIFAADKNGASVDTEPTEAFIARGAAEASAPTSNGPRSDDAMLINKKTLTARSCALSDAETRQKVEEARKKREDDRIEREMRRRLAEGNAKAEGIHKECVQREHDLGQFLKKQIAEKQQKKTAALTERRSTKLECDAVTCIPSEKIDDEEDLRLAASRAQYAAELTKQILHKKMAMINDYEEDQVEHITRLERTTKELEETLSKRQGDRLMKQKQLSTAWKKQLGEKVNRMHKI